LTVWYTITSITPTTTAYEWIQEWSIVWYQYLYREPSSNFERRLYVLLFVLLKMRSPATLEAHGCGFSSEKVILSNYVYECGIFPELGA